MARRPPGVSTSARWLAGVLIAALAIGTVVLAVLAVNRVQPEHAGAGSTSAPSFSFGASATPTPETTPSPTPGPVSSYPRAEERFLSVGSGGMWRGIAGECGETAPLLERSADGGETWEDVTPLYRGIGQLLSLDSFAGTESEAIARMGDDCETQVLRTFTQGEFWEPYPELLAGSRYLDAAASPTVVTPQGPIAAPCADPRSFRVAGSTVALVCQGTPHTLGGDGQWNPLPVTDAVAFGIAGNRIVVATRSAACEGLELTSLTGDGFAQSAPLGCAAADPDAPLAVAATDRGALLWSGDTLLRLP